jgi:hypothetical protein
MTREPAEPTHALAPSAPGWLRELSELAVILGTVGATHLLAGLLGHQRHGPLLLIGVGVVLVTTVAAVRATLHRRAAPVGGESHGRRWLRHALLRLPRRHGPAGGDTLWRIRTTVDDAPGSLARLSESLSHLGVNILAVELHPLGRTVADEFIVQAPPRVGAAELMAAVRTGHGADTWVNRANAHDLADLPARIVGLAARLVADPDELPMVLHDLYSGCLLSWTPTPGTPADGHGALATTMRLPDPHGGWLILTRPALPFSPAEIARAHALADLAAARSDACAG